jgi:hypothetical protein
MIQKGLLTDSEMNFLIHSLSTNIGMNEHEYKQLKLKHPYAVKRDDNAVILSDMKHYGLQDPKLNDFLIKKFGKPEYKLDFFYELIYNKGDYTNTHKDRYIVIQTTLILLNDDFTGGELLIEDEHIDFNKKNMYINFDGYNLKHSVSEVKSGQRRVLVVMFNLKKSVI